MKIVLLEGRRELGNAELITDWALVEPFQFVNKQTITVTITKTGHPTHFAIKGPDGRTVKIGTIAVNPVASGNSIIIALGNLHIDVEQDATPPIIRKQA